MKKIIGIIIAAFITFIGEIALYLKGRQDGKEKANNANLKADNQALQTEVQNVTKATQIDNTIANTNIDVIANELRSLNSQNQSN
jgi:hypothetical protein